MKALAAVLVLLAACGGGSPSGPTTTAPSTTQAEGTKIAGEVSVYGDGVRRISTALGADCGVPTADGSGYATGTVTATDGGKLLATAPLDKTGTILVADPVYCKMLFSMTIPNPLPAHVHFEVAFSDSSVRGEADFAAASVDDARIILHL